MRFTPVRDYFLLGKALKSHGTSGQLRLMVDDRLRSYIQEGSFIFFDLNGSKVPFRITGQEEGQHFVIALEDIAGKQASDALSGKEIWIPVEQVKSRHLRSPKNLLEKWEDFSILDEKTGITFPILRTEEYPQQLMAIIRMVGKEILIPLHEQLITSIDRDTKTIRMEFPEGLLEL